MTGKRCATAILTWVNYYNYGSLLQAFALQTKVGEKKNVKIIDYLPLQNNTDYIKSSILTKVFHKVRKLIKGNSHDEYVSENRKIAFDNFKKQYINFTKKCTDVCDLVELNTQFDTFIAGSDQIWAPTCFNDYFFLNFVADNKRKIAYAPSIGTNRIDNKYLADVYQKYLSRFDALSVREHESADLLKEKFNINAQCVLDPTLLLTKEEWINILDVKKTDKKYLLVYFLGANEKYFKQVEWVAKELDLEVKIIPTLLCDYKRGYDFEDNVGPKEFVELIANASYVCTDSFHGTAFSLIFNKQFSVFKRFKENDKNCQNSRIYNILDIIQDRSPLVADKIKINNLNYDSINLLLQKEREKSLAFLYDSLGFEKQEKQFNITDRCTGCGACKEVCPKGAIILVRNKQGFYEAKINEELCVECGLCKKICANNYRQAVAISSGEAYSFKAEANILKSSASGGIAYILAEKFSKQGYAVYGCVMENDYVYHKLALPNDIEILKEFQGSKYLQSDFSKNLNTLLSLNGKKIVFGTPCQIAGLNNTLLKNNQREDYILVDLICHGVPSYNLWIKFKEYIKQKYKIKESKIIFRDKNFKWQDMMMTISNDEKKIASPENKNMFYHFFNTGCCYNQSCYTCHYRDKSCADIRIGDYWGNKFKSDTTGVSIAVSLTRKGRDITNSLGCLKQEIEDYTGVQQTKNYFEPIYYDALIEDMSNNNISLEKIYNKYINEEVREKRVYNRLYKIYIKLIKR